LLRERAEPDNAGAVLARATRRIGDASAVLQERAEPDNAGAVLARATRRIDDASVVLQERAARHDDLVDLAAWAANATER